MHMYESLIAVCILQKAEPLLKVTIHHTQRKNEHVSLIFQVCIRSWFSIRCQKDQE